MLTVNKLEVIVLNRDDEDVTEAATCPSRVPAGGERASVAT